MSSSIQLQDTQDGVKLPMPIWSIKEEKEVVKDEKTIDAKAFIVMDDCLVNKESWVKTNPTVYETVDQLLGHITELSQIDETSIGQVVTVAGWVHEKRPQKELIFVKLFDSAGSKMAPLQIVFDLADVVSNITDVSEYAKIYVGASMVIKGLIIKSPAKGQKIEMKGQICYVVGEIEDPEHYPLAGSASSNMELLRGIPQLECQSTRKNAIYKVRSELSYATETFFRQKGYAKVDMPLITFSECEGGCQPMQATLLLTEGKKSKIPHKDDAIDVVDFSKDFFGVKASLTVSAQLELETHLPLGNVWTMTRAIRGEPSQTTRHLCEFSMIEIEKRFSKSARDIMDISEEFIKFCIRYALEHCSLQLEFLESKRCYGKEHRSKLQTYLDTPFVRITHAQAVEMLLQDVADKKVKFTSLPAYDDDMGSEHERYLVDVKYKLPVIVMRYPKVVKAFYMPVLQETLEESHGVEHVDSFDILVPDVGELVGGSQRIHKYDELVARIDELGLDKRQLQFYIDLRRYGSVPHSGMGLGVERLVKFITGAESVKDCVAFPRFLGSGKLGA